ncbi:hypothetical protein IIC38_16885 [candidate division KSB1 bacterium]|nr:hypothetical protein [candidate division KSB1 bacterium]
MKKRHILIITLFAFVISVVSFAGKSHRFDDENSTMAPKDHQVSIIKIKGEWKVVLTQDHKKKIKAKKKDKITWKVEGTDVFFQFMDESLFGKSKSSGKKNKPVTLTIRDNVSVGTYKYAVFCLEDSTFATGYSPPVIIIEE